MEKNPFLGRLFQGFCYGLFRFYCPIKVRGLENLPKDPFILCSNHCSHLDSAALMHASNISFHRFAMLAAKDYFFENPLRRVIVSSLLRMIPAERQKVRIDESLSLCKEWRGNLIMFPEGTRSRTGELQRMKKGVALFAHEMDMPIVPAYIEGSFEAMPKGKNWIRPRKIRVSFGKPIYVEKEANMNVYRQVIQELETRIRELA